MGSEIKKEIYADLVWNKEVLEKQIPGDLLPVGSTEGGNVICIGAKPHNYGKIYFWDHEFETDTDRGDVADYSNIKFIADDFENFLGVLYEYTPDDEE